MAFTPIGDALGRAARAALWCAAAALLALPPGPALGLHTLLAPKAELWPRWTAHDPAATATIDHSDWGRFLETYVQSGPDGVNRVAYGRVSGTDEKALAGYLLRLAGTPISIFNRPEQLAFWINLYNALTLHVILENIGVRSIRDIDISPGLLTDGPWKKKLVRIEGEALSLDDIEHRILRPIWRDARIHYAVSCAALGCPNLMVTAFTGANAEVLLSAGARAYVNHPRGARVEGGKLIVSSLYRWYRADFGGSDAGIIAHLKKYAAPDLAARLATVDGIAGDAYDWGLNAAP